jgi:hypothetical protein
MGWLGAVRLGSIPSSLFPVRLSRAKLLVKASKKLSEHCTFDKVDM